MLCLHSGLVVHSPVLTKAQKSQARKKSIFLQSHFNEHCYSVLMKNVYT